MPPVTRFRASEGHLLVCGDDKLAHQVARELTTRYRERVTVILPSKRHGHGPQIDRLPGVRVLERDELTSQAFTDAQITSARALALLRQDDVGNFHAALRARELNPDIRLVLAVFSPGLGDQVRAFFPDCAVLVGTAMSAPSFTAAALGEPAPATSGCPGAPCTWPGVRTPIQARCCAGWPPRAVPPRHGCCRRTSRTPTSCWPSQPGPRVIRWPACGTRCGSQGSCSAGWSGTGSASGSRPCSPRESPGSCCWRWHHPGRAACPAHRGCPGRGRGRAGGQAGRGSGAPR